MADNRKYLKIGSIVDQFLIDNDLPDKFFAKGLSWALWGLRELHLDVFQDVKTCLLPVTDRKTVIAPADYVDWTKVAVKYGQYVVTLSLNDKLSRLERSVDDVTYMNPFGKPNGIDIESYSGYYMFNHAGSAVLSYGSGLPSKGTFNVVKRDSCYELILDYDLACNEIYLEYITDGFDPCKETVLNPYFADYVLKYIEFKYEEKSNPSRNESSIYRKGRSLWDAEQKVRGRVNSIDPATMIAISRRETRLTPKIRAL